MTLRSRARCTADAGESLIEVLLSIALMGIGFVAVLGAMQLGLMGSEVHRSQATSETVMLSAVERVKAGSTTYKPCAVANDADYLPRAQSAAPADWSAATISIPSVQYWNGTGFQSGGCAALEAIAPILRIQLITVQVTSPNGDATESMSFVKRG